MNANGYVGDVDDDHTFQRVVIGFDRNAERPLDAIKLINAVSGYLSELCDKESPDKYPLAPFIVRDIVFDMREGCAAVYFYRQIGES